MEKHSKTNDSKYSAEIYYPFFLFKVIVAMMIIFILVAIILVVAFPVGLDDPADPTDNLYIPKPVWYFMFLYQLFKYFPGKLEVIAVTIVPAGSLLLLVLIPFIDKNPEKRPWKRPIAMTSMGIAVTAIIVLAVIGFTS